MAKLQKIFTIVIVIGLFSFGESFSLATTKVFIVAGQSNASGRAFASGLPTELLKQTDVRYWFDTDRGFRRDQFIDLRTLQGSFGPEITLGRTLADAIADDVVIVKVAVGGTQLNPLAGRDDWNPNSPGELYDRMIDNVVTARQALVDAGEQVELAGLFWMQGE